MIEKFDLGAVPFTGYFIRLYQNGTPTFSTGNGTTQLYADGTAPVSANVWHHIAGVFTGSEMDLYVDGALDRTTTTSQAPAASVADLHLGADYGSNRMGGNLDDARIYNRGLSAAEVAILFAGQPPPTGVIATPGPNQITLTWTAAAGATSYRIYRALAATGPFVAIGTSATTTYVDNTVVNPTTYWYEVTAVIVMESCPTAALSAVPLLPGPKAPSHTTHNLAHRCGCSSVQEGGGLVVGLMALAALIVLVRRR